MKRHGHLFERITDFGNLLLAPVWAGNALIKDGWTITHDPLRLKWGDKDMYVDLAAERF